MRKVTYVAPAIEVMELEHEGVIAGSGNQLSNDVPAINPGGTGALPSINHTGSEGGFSISGIEDLINDILTFEE